MLKILSSLWVTRQRRSVTGTVAVNGCSAVVSLSCAIVLARLLGVAQYGLYAYAISVSGLAGALAGFGIPTLVLRQAAAWSATSQWVLLRGIVKFGLLATFASASIFGILLVAISPFLGSISHTPKFAAALALAVIVMICTAQAQVIEAVLQARGVIAPSLIPRVIILPGGVLTYALAAHFFRLTVSSISILAAQSVIGVGVLLYLFRLLACAIPAEARHATPAIYPMKWLGSALPFFGNNIMFVINTQVDILLLGYFKGDSSAAIYRVGTKGAQVLILCLAAIVTVVQPRMAALYAEGRHRELGVLVTRSTRAGFYIALSAAILFVAFGGQIISALFGRAFVAAAVVLSILTVSRLAHAATGSLGAYLSMTGKEHTLMHALIAESCANVILNILLIPRWGIEGAAFATGISMAAMNTLLALYVYKKWGVDVSIFGKYKSVLTRA